MLPPTKGDFNEAIYATIIHHGNPIRGQLVRELRVSAQASCSVFFTFVFSSGFGMVRMMVVRKREQEVAVSILPGAGGTICRRRR